MVRSSLVVTTSGLEEEVLYALWKWIHHIPVYQNAFAPPFAQSYYNWLFYVVYGQAVGSSLRLFGLSDESLPLLARLVTLGLTVVAMAVVARMIAVKRPGGHAILFSLVILLTPLNGFWVLTARPDMAALLFELAGLGAILLSGKKQWPGLFWLSISAFYCAWAFKQTNVAGWLAACIYLFWIGRPSRALILFAVPAFLFGVTLASGGPDFRYAMLQANFHPGYSPVQSVQLFGRALLKAPLFGAGLLVVLHALIVERRKDLLVIAAGVALFIGLLTAGKELASDNYFIPAATFASIALCDVLAKSTTLAAIIPFAFQAGVGGAILLGFAGRTAPAVTNELTLLKPNLIQIGKPALVTELGGNLPWFQPMPPNFVFAPAYFIDRAAGESFVNGGMGGMIRSGQIGVVVCPKADPCAEFDGADLSRLPLIREDAYWRYLSTTSATPSTP